MRSEMGHEARQVPSWLIFDVGQNRNNSYPEMKSRAILVALSIVIAFGALAACSSSPREKRKPSVAVLISFGKGDRPSPPEIAEIHKLLQPEIEKRGYVMARSSRTTDYFVEVRYPLDPLSINRITFVRAEPTVPFLKDTDPDQRFKDYKRAIADMVAEPSTTKP
jgi:hypothetical protein